MKLLSNLFYIVASTPFDFSETWIDTKSNGQADSLSHLDFSHFWQLALNANIVITQPTDLDSVVTVDAE